MFGMKKRAHDDARLAVLRYLVICEGYCGENYVPKDHVTAKDARCRDKSALVFQMPWREMPNWQEQSLLGPEASQALIVFLAWVGKFNNYALKVEAEWLDAKPAERAALLNALHGTIGSEGTNTMHDAYVTLMEALSC